MGYYALTVLLSAFLLFQIQPLIGKVILPWFGGSLAVWSTAMLFFQVALVAGYAYAYGLVGRLSPRKQGIVHLALLGCSVALLLLLGWAWGSPTIPDVRWRPLGAEAPQWQVIKVLTVAVGGQFLVLATTGPLMQTWFARRWPERSPYRLYALSNAGSLLGLIAYPFLVEPLLALKAQANLWALAYVAFAVCAGYGALRAMRRGRAPEAQPSSKEARRPGIGARVLWIAFSTCAVVLLLAATNQMCLDVAVVPFLWVLPLAVYLLSFILCFSPRRWYSRKAYVGAFFVGTVIFCWVLYFGQVTLLVQIGVYTLVLFIGCMVCHGELARLKPRPRYLASFYLLISIGGALGSVLVNLVAPRLFADFWELPVGLLGCWLLLLIVSLGDSRPEQGHRSRLLSDTLLMGGIAVLGVVLVFYVIKGSADVLWSSRDFYGVLQVKERDADQPEQRAYTAVHNGTLHGFQYLDEEKRRLPTAYYIEEGGMGLALLHHPRRDAGLRIGAVGLGVGTLAAYGRPVDAIRFYEINPAVVQLAAGEGAYFTYLPDCPAQIEIVPGDARVSLERELAAGDPQGFDLLVVDAFSGDSIPVHLLTVEAFDVYLAHLRPDGIIALHISNRYMDLRPVVQALADRSGLGTALVVSDRGGDRRGTPATWMLVTADETFLAQPEIVERSSPWQARAGPRLWTDDHSSVFQALDLRQLSVGLLEDSDSLRDAW